MKFSIFGLTISSSWGNGHATIWRGLCSALIKRGHSITFFEKDVPYYADQRDKVDFSGLKLILYSSWEDIHDIAEKNLKDTDIAIVTSYCPDGISASELVLNSNAPMKVFYDLDTPITLNSLEKGEKLFYVGERGFQDFDLVLSYTGGKALDELKTKLGAKRTAVLYGCADINSHKPVPKSDTYKSDFSYLGTYARDRQASLEKFFINVAAQLPDKNFIIGGSMYPESFPWQKNINYIYHVPPGDHPAFYCSSDFTLNITRGTMAEMGYCPSGRLFEASACATPIISDYWEGMERFFTPGNEIIIIQTTSDVIEALQLPKSERNNIAMKAHERTLAEHTSEHRAAELEDILESSFVKYNREE
jgi:spore maturation protein CgeB